MFKWIKYLGFYLLFVLVSCSGSEKYRTAHAYFKDGKSFIKLKCKRQLSSHDPGSLLSNKTYDDSIILQVPSLKSGLINGEDIPAKEGYYSYVGTVTVKDAKVKVSLSYNNTDSHEIEPTPWNGNYALGRE